jgi:hypothetical protein
MENTLDWTEFLPLALFFWGGRLLHMVNPTVSTTALAFTLGGALALIQMLYSAYQGRPIDYIALGCNLFLMGGAGASALNVLLKVPYSLFNQTSLFIWILLVGVVTTLLSPKGFIQLSKKSISPFSGSVPLLALTVAAFMVSYSLITLLQFGTGLGVGIPLITLISLREVLRRDVFLRA